MEDKVMESHFLEIIKQVGEDSNREGLIKTPSRASKAMHFLTQGYAQDAGAILQSAVFKEDYSEMEWNQMI